MLPEVPSTSSPFCWICESLSPAVAVWAAAILKAKMLKAMIRAARLEIRVM
jgi:hypothetical protein